VVVAALEGGCNHEAETVLYVGERWGGPMEDSPDLSRAMSAFYRMVDEERPPAGPDDLSIDLVFDVSGPILQWDYQGIRTGRLSRKRRLLQIQVAVPDKLEKEEIWPFLEDALEKVYALAKEYHDDHRLGYSLDALKGVVDRVLDRIRRGDVPPAAVLEQRVAEFEDEATDELLSEEAYVSLILYANRPDLVREGLRYLRKALQIPHDRESLLLFQG
jgi:hypothetical protein